jgi:hypothetical protein
MTCLHCVFVQSVFVFVGQTLAAGFVEKQGFTKCVMEEGVPNPTYKFCPEVQLVNALVLLTAAVTALAVGAVYVRWTAAMGGGALEEDMEARAALVRHDSND